jgi:hypothetical protein
VLISLEALLFSCGDSNRLLLHVEIVHCSWGLYELNDVCCISAIHIGKGDSEPVVVVKGHIKLKRNLGDAMLQELVLNNSNY